MLLCDSICVQSIAQMLRPVRTWKFHARGLQSRVSFAVVNHTLIGVTQTLSRTKKSRNSGHILRKMPDSKNPFPKTMSFDQNGRIKKNRFMKARALALIFNDRNFQPCDYDQPNKRRLWWEVVCIWTKSSILLDACQFASSLQGIIDVFGRYSIYWLSESYYMGWNVI